LPDLRGNRADPKKINEELCEFRRRLSGTNTDQWWKHENTETSMIRAVSEAAEVYVNFGRPLLARVSGPDAAINTVLAEDFAEGRFDFGGFGSTRVRMALALSRLRTTQGRVSEAVSFATLGLANVGGAVALRRELEQLAGQP